MPGLSTSTEQRLAAYEHAGALGFCRLFSLAPLVIIVVAISDLVGSQAATAVGRERAVWEVKSPAVK
jgi:uncharacterized BrkB/YihY/UPF0761 family membrane protein